MGFLPQVREEDAKARSAKIFAALRAEPVRAKALRLRWMLCGESESSIHERVPYSREGRSIENGMGFGQNPRER